MAKFTRAEEKCLIQTLWKEVENLDLVTLTKKTNNKWWNYYWSIETPNFELTRHDGSLIVWIDSPVRYHMQHVLNRWKLRWIFNSTMKRIERKKENTETNELRDKLQDVFDNCGL